MTFWALLAAWVLLGSTPALAAVDAQALWADPVTKVRVDGMLRDWKARMSKLDVQVSGKTAGTRAEAAVGYDDDNIYIALDVVDDRIVRTARAGRGEDYATLLLAFPTSASGYETHRIELYPGIAGSSAALMKVDGKTRKTATIVEAANAEGFTLEASLPWSTFPSAAKVRTGLRAAVRYTDADRPGTPKGTIGTSRAANGAALPPLMLEAEQGLYQSIIRAHGLGTKPAKQLTGDVCGDEMLEQVAIYGQFLTIVGAHYRDGREFYFSDLQVRDASMVTRLELHDFDGDGKQEILTVRRLGKGSRYREVLQVIKLSGSGEPKIELTHETGVKSDDGLVVNEVKVGRTGGKIGLVIKSSKTSKVERDEYDEPRPADMPSALLPWDEVTSRTYQWSGHGFEEVARTKQKVTPAPGVSRTTGSTAGAGLAAPRPPNPEELLDQVYSLYKRERKVAEHEPTFDFVTNVAGDQTPERVLVHGRDVVVFGKGFLGGASYTYITMGVETGGDVIDVTAKDLTGDGLAEIVARLDIRATASEELGGQEVVRHALVVYSVKGTRLARVFAAEIGRAVGDARILGAIAFVPSSAGGVSIELRPGAAIGWTQSSYPFPEDVAPSGGLEAFVLPWMDQVRRYEFDGESYSR